MQPLMTLTTLCWTYPIRLLTDLLMFVCRIMLVPLEKASNLTVSYTLS